MAAIGFFQFDEEKFKTKILNKTPEHCLQIAREIEQEHPQENLNKIQAVALAYLQDRGIRNCAVGTTFNMPLYLELKDEREAYLEFYDLVESIFGRTVESRYLDAYIHLLNVIE